MLPAVDGSGNIALGDYRGRVPLFLALFIGLWCPFCRRALAQLATTEQSLKANGIETLAVVATAPENARLYFKFRPTRVRLGADPELTTHRAYGVPRPEATPEFMQILENTRINPEGMFPEPLSIIAAGEAITRTDGFIANKTDQADLERQWPQLKGQFLIDREGIVRWVHIDCAKGGPAEIANFPSSSEILAAARSFMN
jgi:peroxiredoxin